MKSFSILFFLLIALLLSACNEEDSRDIPSKERAVESNNSVSYILSDYDDNNLSFNVSQENMSISGIRQPIILINFFSTWSAPCRAQLSVLSKLQEKYKKDLFVAGLLINDEISQVKLKYFAKKYHADYYISASKNRSDFIKKIIESLDVSKNNPIPLSVLYKNGKYYRFYEGVLPIEILDYELKQVINQL